MTFAQSIHRLTLAWLPRWKILRRSFATRLARIAGLRSLMAWITPVSFAPSEKPRCFIARRGDRVVGVISVSHCRMRKTDGEWGTAAYISDLKVNASGGGRCLLRLLRDAAEWAQRAPLTPGFSVVMDGTARRPTAYSGRAGYPRV